MGTEYLGEDYSVCDWFWRDGWPCLVASRPGSCPRKRCNLVT